MRSLSFSISQSLLKLMSIESVTPPNHFILYHPLLLLSSIFSSIRVFSKESALCITWPKYWNFSISPSNEYSGLISFRMDWVDLLALQGVLKSCLQYHKSKVSVLQWSTFFMAQLSHLYMTTGKTIAWIIWIFASKRPYSQSYGFFSSHVRMWELDHKEGSAPKNWCLQIVLLKKTLESSLDYKKSKSVNPKGNQSWIFIRRTDAVAKAPVLWPPAMKSQLIRKDPNSGKDWRQKEKRATEDEIVR